MLVRVEQPFEYAQRMRSVGEEIDMPSDYARVLKIMGKVAEAKPAASRGRGRYARRDLRAEE
jgi:hypothetical protein